MADTYQTAPPPSSCHTVAPMGGDTDATRILEISDAFFTLDREWRFTYLNTQAEQLLLRTREQLQGRGVWEEFPGAVRTTAEREFRFSSIQPAVTAFEDIDPPLSAWFEVHTFPSAEGLSVFFQEINASKKAEAEREQVQEALRLSESSLREAQRVAHLGSWEYEIDTGKIHWSQETFRLFDYDFEQDEPTYEMLMTRYHPDDALMHTAMVQKIIKDGLPYAFDIRIFRRDGSFCWAHAVGQATCDADGKPIRLLGTVIDISDRKFAELALAESEEHFRALYETMAQGVLYQDTAGTLISANPAAQRILGMTTDEMAGRISADLRWKAVHEDGTAYPGNQHPPMQALRTGQPVRGVVMGVFNPRLNEMRWLRVDGVPQFRPGEDRPYQAYSTFEDITEARQAEAEKDRAEEKIAALLVREHQVAATLQRSLLQMQPPGSFPGLDVGFVYEGATDDMDVGGDFLDSFALGNGRVALVVGDVSGKGLEAAAKTSEAKFALRAFLSEHPRPGSALTELNRYLSKSKQLSGENEGFICLSLAVLDTTTGEATFSSAGAEPPLIVRASGEAEEVPIYGTPLTALETACYMEATKQLGLGDLLVMVTDGVTEARRGGEFLGYEGLRQLAVEVLTSPTAEQAAHRILSGAKAFSGETLRDDVCVLVARRVSLEASSSLEIVKLPLKQVLQAVH